MSENWLAAAYGLLNVLLVGVGLYLAHNLVDRRLDSYTRLWDLMKVAGPWRIESKLGPMSVQQRKELFDSMTDWYYSSGNGMMLTRETREIYLNAKFNLICDDEKLRPETLNKHHALDQHERERWRGQLSMEQP